MFRWINVTGLSSQSSADFTRTSKIWQHLSTCVSRCHRCSDLLPFNIVLHQMFQTRFREGMNRKCLVFLLPDTSSDIIFNLKDFLINLRHCFCRRRNKHTTSLTLTQPLKKQRQITICDLFAVCLSVSTYMLWHRLFLIVNLLRKYFHLICLERAAAGLGSQPGGRGRRDKVRGGPPEAGQQQQEGGQHGP